MAELIDGKALAKEVRAEVKTRAEAFAAKHGRAPGLHVVLVGEDPASQVYVRNKERAAGKAGIAGEVHRLPAETTEADLLALVAELNAAPDIDGILVQLPLPDHLDDQMIVDAIDPSKDVDGLHPFNAGLLVVGRKGLRPCTPSGCMRMLEHVGCNPKGKRALVLGRSTLVGKPIALMLLEKHATVTIAHSRTENLAHRVREADIVVAAVGRPNLVKGDWIKERAVVIDVGINRLEAGSLTGDVDFEGASKHASYITPVPGGVGPMTIAMLLSNTVDAAEARAR
ncbi:MAG: bifunctional methylenetetrahydrofolate dehydrogenase/methenyltetrahydrofolate cyclohydrolase FolD [Myxococcales bacterium]|nr:bifunctional methylenetetrahydrofolate dehydrogenase/methenyltetrahydrofolate cyclohydrolase FolD [Myxococcales bacterium]MDH3484497.1 bifunctional methylenetetrahydrofolate dehydrogenase/methenyltetrahydrofolate cyclohydrolase FolD [Myxococcales bacterium]